MRLLLAGNGGWLNRGCEAIETETRRILDTSFHRPDFTVLPFSSDDAREHENPLPGLERLTPPDFSVRRYSPAWIRMVAHNMLASAGYRVQIDVLREATSPERYDGALLIGGDNITLDYGYPDPHLATLEWLADADVPTCVWAASVGPFDKDPRYERRVAKILSRVALITVRESESAKYLRSLGLATRVEQVADPAFLLEASVPAREVADILPEGAIGVNLSPLLGRYRWAEDDWMSLAADTVKGILALGSPVVLVPHAMTPGTSDAPFLREIADRIASPEVITLPGSLSANELKWCISRLRVLVAARTHATIAAYSSGVPVVALSYSAKARGIANDLFGDHRWLLSTEEITAQRVVSLTKALLAEEGRIRDVLLQRAEEMKVLAWRGGELLAEAIAASG